MKSAATERQAIVHETRPSVAAGRYTLEASEYVWIHMTADQIGLSLKEKGHRMNAIKKTALVLPKLSFLSTFYHKYQNTFSFTQSPLKPLRSKEKEKEKEIYVGQVPC